MNGIRSRILQRGSMISIMATSLMAGTAMAQTPDAGVESVVVTGTSIRGIAPVGSNLVTLDSKNIDLTAASTMQDVLSAVPQLGTFNQAPTPTGNSDGFVSTAPNLRNIGQAQTLNLIDGHRFVGSGHLQTISDPSVVPTAMVERVEILPDGASAVYGSDAISGVVNLITRKDYDGVQLKVGGSAADGYLASTASVLFGSTWDGGGFAAAIEYAGNGHLSAMDRSFVTSNFTPTGGTDARSIGCPSPNVTVNGVNYSYPGFTAGGQVRCDTAKQADIYPEQDRVGAMVNWHQDLWDGVRLHGDLFASRQDTNTHVGAGQLSSLTVPNTNPYFTLPAGVNATSETVTIGTQNALGAPYLTDRNNLTTYGGTIGVDVDLFQDFVWSTYVTGSSSITGLYEQSYDTNAAAVAAAGTTTATALDPFQNRTSAPINSAIANQENFFGSHQHLAELNTKIDGPLFDLPGGTVRAAVGGVLREESFDGIQTSGQRFMFQNPGTAEGTRHVGSIYGELFVPLIGDGNQLPLVRSLELSVEGRYDNYNDFGATTNPKYGVNWKPTDDLTIHASYGTSFHAPALADLHGPDTRAGYYVGGAGAPGFNNAQLANVYLAGGNANLQPERSLTKSLGFDWKPSVFPGLHLGATYYSIYFTGQVGYPDGSQFFVNPAYNKYFYFNNGGFLSPALVASVLGNLRQIGFPATGATYPPLQVISDFRRVNLAAIKTQGIDFDAAYTWETAWGGWLVTLDGEQGLTYQNSPIPGAPYTNSYQTGQVPLNMRAVLSWNQGPMEAALKVNYSSSYKDLYTTTAGGSAYEAVQSFTTVALYAAYDLGSLAPLGGFVKDTQLSFNVDNVLDTAPPYSMSTARFANGGYGYGNPIGRLFTVSLVNKF